MGPSTVPCGIPLTTAWGDDKTLLPEQFGYVREKLINPAQDLSSNAITFELSKQNLVIHFVEGLGIVHVDHVNLIVSVEALVNELNVAKQLGQTTVFFPEPMLVVA